MSRGSSRATILDPSALISLIKKLYEADKIKNEVLLRRSISALYFALFNYWSAKMYDAGKRGSGQYKDSWRLRDFTSEMLQKGLDPQVRVLYGYRVAVDHYTLNPTIAYLRDFGKKQRILINEFSLKRSIECAEDLYQEIKNSI
ncbi:hypothetical protein J7L29_01395 [Candidatus Bathyarchaeota archaeon]|nr:hypothetical protein [Candidatus Bathyarchaeota archaeon]